MALIERDLTNPYTQFTPEFLENEVEELECQARDFEYRGDFEHADQARSWKLMAGLAIEQLRR